MYSHLFLYTINIPFFYQISTNLQNKLKQLRDQFLDLLSSYHRLMISWKFLIMPEQGRLQRQKEVNRSGSHRMGNGYISHANAKAIKTRERKNFTK